MPHASPNATLTRICSSYITEDIAQLNATGEISEIAVKAEGEEKTTWFVWLLVCCTSISGLLFGQSCSHFPKSPFV